MGFASPPPGWGGWVTAARGATLREAKRTQATCLSAQP
jgi:hypothetical protein